MFLSHLHGFAILPFVVLSPAFPFPVVSAQSSSLSSYSGYTRSSYGADPTAAVYDTASTSANVSTTVPEPDVFLNASVSVAEIDLTVTNLTAKINLQAQVLNLLNFNAGVDASIDEVRLLIQNVSARVILEARLENLVLMVGDILDSLDLNPVLATLGNDVGTIINDTGSLLTGTASASTAAATSTSLSVRSFQLDNNILYSVNDYSGNTHTNRILQQNGDIVDEKLDNHGNTQSTTKVGYYATDMKFNGYNETIVRNGQEQRELQYIYTPFAGLESIIGIFTDLQGNVVSTRLLAEASGGGTSTIDEL